MENEKAIASEIIAVSNSHDWTAYHTIRRAELFEARGRTDYNPNHPDETKPGHFPLLLKVAGKGVGVARLDMFTNGTAAVRLVAITKPEQGKGYGRELMTQLEAIAREKGAKRLALNAAKTAVEFYEKLGFVRSAWEDPNEHLDDKYVQMTKEV